MPTEEEPTAIIGGIDGRATVPGSQKYCCFHCHGDTWLAPASIRMLTTHPAIKIICLHCYIADPAYPADTETMVNRAEVAEHVGSELLADKLIEHGTKHLAELKRKGRKSEPWKKN